MPHAAGRSLSHPAAEVLPDRGSRQWYVNGPAGLEQGFTLAEAPGNSRGEPLTLTFSLSGSLGAAADPTRTSATLSRGDGTHIQVTSAQGQPSPLIPVRLE